MIEYRVRGELPERWERGVIVREVDGGSTRQFLIREKPNQFYPEGFEVAFDVKHLRKTTAKPRPAVLSGVNPSAPIVLNNDPTAVRPAPGIAPNVAGPAGTGLLTKDEIRAYAMRLFGEGDPFANPRRELLLNHLRDYIKARGTNFQTDAAFSNQMSELGVYSVHMGYAIAANYGPAPSLKSYFGTFLLRAANRGSRSVSRQWAGVIVTTEDSHRERRIDDQTGGNVFYGNCSATIRRNSGCKGTARGQGWRETALGSWAGNLAGTRKAGPRLYGSCISRARVQRMDRCRHGRSQDAR
ncbi:MAG: hypothetical protein R3C05_10395 [Pirellulaceae bacterium]